MIRPRPLIPVAISFALLAVACSGGESSDPAQSSPQATTTEETSPAPTGPPVDDPDLPTLDDLRNAAFDGEEGAELTLALTQFAVDYGPVEGAVDVAVDTSMPTSASLTLHGVEAVWEELSLDQQSQIADAIQRLDDASEQLGEVDEVGQTLDLSTISVPEVAEAEPHGFASPAAPRRPVLQTLDGDEAIATAREAAGYVAGRLGGEVHFNLKVAPAATAPGSGVDATTNTTVFPPGSEILELINDTIGRTCDITLFDRAHMTGARLRSVIAHEVFHCWTYVNSEETADHNVLVEWFAEGMATWVGEQFAGGSSFGQIWWSAYFDPQVFPLYRTKYRAFGFWSQIAQLQGGDDVLWGMIPALTVAAARGDNTTYAAATTGLPLAQWALLASNGAREPAWGADWDHTGVGIPSDSRPIIPQAVTGAAPIEHSAGPGEQLIVRFDIDPLLSDGPWVVTYTGEGLVNARWDDGTAFQTTESIERQWCLDGPCVCPDESEPLPGLDDAPGASRELWVALTGATAGISGASLSLDDVDDLCEETPATTVDVGAPDGSLAGQWRADPESIAQMFREASAFGGGDGAALDIAGANGDLLMDLRSDGTGSLTYNNVSLFLNDAVLGDMTLNGQGTFSWGISDGLMAISNSDFNIGVTSTAMGELLALTDEDVGGPAGSTELVVSYTGGNDLNLLYPEGSLGTVFFPRHWFKQ